MATPGGFKLYLNIQKGFRPYEEAVEDQKYLVENEWTGESWYWANRKGERISGTQL